MSVVLNIGDSTGALVLYTPATMDGWEIEISRTSGDPATARTHNVVRRRETGVAGAQVFAAVYPDLPAGDYAVWRDDTTQATTTTIAGGRVTSCRWPDS